MDSVVMGLDCGFGFCKGVTERKTLMFPSVVSSGTNRTFVDGVVEGVLDQKNLTVLYQDEAYFVGQLAMHQGHYPRATLDKSRTRSREMEVLFLTMVALLSPEPTATVKVVTGLPVTDFGDREWLIEHFTGQHDLTINGVPFHLTIKSVSVIPQPYGSYLSALFPDDKGADAKLGRGTVAVIDVGYLTTDMILVRQGEYIEKACTSLADGISSVYRHVGRILSQRYPSRMEERDVEEIVRSGMIQHMGQTIPLDRTLIHPEFQAYAKRIAAVADTLWAKEQVGVLLGTGGGILALRSALLERWPHFRILADAQFGNVRGYLRFGRMRA
jgi:plasmid segregation protein ParM